MGTSGRPAPTRASVDSRLRSDLRSTPAHCVASVDHSVHSPSEGRTLAILQEDLRVAPMGSVRRAVRTLSTWNVEGNMHPPRFAGSSSCPAPTPPLSQPGSGLPSRPVVTPQCRGSVVARDTQILVPGQLGSPALSRESASRPIGRPTSAKGTGPPAVAELAKPSRRAPKERILAQSSPRRRVSQRR